MPRAGDECEGKDRMAGASSWSGLARHSSRYSPSPPTVADKSDGTGGEKDERAGFGHDIRSHVERQRLPPA